MTQDPGTLTVMLDAGWRVSLLLALAWGMARLMRRYPASLRHAVWATALVAALAVPLLAGLMPSWQLRMLPAGPQARAVLESPRTPPPSRPLPARASVATASLPDQAATRVDALPEAAAGPAPGPRAPADWLGLLWAAVAAALVGRYFASATSIRWLTRDAETVEAPRWRDARDVAAARLGLSRTPALLSSEHVTVPFTSGVFRPVVVVPSSGVAEWSDERIQVVLLHELAHVRRRDCLVQAVTQMACAAYWFNPLTWVAARRLRSERERACDDLVLEAGMRGADYAHHLLDIARSATAGRSLSSAALAMARPSELEGRLLSILGSKPGPRRVPGRPSWRSAAVVAAVALPLATVQPVAREALPPDPVVSAAARPLPPSVAPSLPPAVPRHPAAPEPAAAQSPVDEPREADTSTRAGKTAARVAASVAAVIVDRVAVVADGMAVGVGHRVADHIVDALSEVAFAQDERDAGKAASRTPASPAVVAGLTEALKDTDADVRKQAMQALTRLGAPVAFEALLAAIKDEDADVRQQAAHSLARLRDTRAVQPLIGALKDEDADVRQQAAFALGHMGATEAVPGLIAALEDSDEDVRQSAIFGLVKLGDRSAIPAYVGALKDESEDVRQQAVFALSRVGDSSVVPAIVRLLASDESEDVRQQAAFALSQIGDESAVPALTAALKDPSADVRRQAISALSELADGDADRPRRGGKGPAAAPPSPAMPKPAPDPRPAPAPPR